MVTNHVLKERTRITMIEGHCSDSETFKLISPFFDESRALYYFFHNDLELEKREAFCIEYE